MKKLRSLTEGWRKFFVRRSGTEISDSIKERNRERVRKLLSRIPKRIPPELETVLDITVGGLLYIGFSEIQTNKLICISSQKETLIDCDTGKISSGGIEYDESDLIACAEELGEEVVHLAGICGGGLRRCGYGDSLDLTAMQYPESQLIYSSSWKSFWMDPEDSSIIYEGYEIRAYGFSRCGRYIAVADSGELLVLRKRENEKKGVSQR